jgi:hypothetical protein
MGVRSEVVLAAPVPNWSREVESYLSEETCKRVMDMPGHTVAPT